MPIQVLPPQLANQIAAGEVVERPASVVKELVENSLDAGATRIDIDIERGGTKLIRIRDNGSGIAKDELALALSRHATSKITSLDDLEAIISLGFRGEALASISAVSRLTMTSRPEGQREAWQAYAEGRDMAVTIKPAAHPVGTTTEVLDLFYNTPARRKFLRTEKTEFTHIDEVIRRIALARFDVAITLNHNGKTVRQYRTADSADAKARRLAAICGTGFMEHALAIEWQHGDLALHGWVAEPQAVTSAMADIQYSYVNHRMMRDRLINHAIRQACEDKLGAGNQPAFVLYLTVDPHQVDVNVHPAKHEVRFHQARLVHDFIYQGVVAILQPPSDASLVSPGNDVSRLPENRPAAGVNRYTQPAVAETPRAVLRDSGPAKPGGETGPGSVRRESIPAWPNATQGYQKRQGALYQQLLKTDEKGVTDAPLPKRPPLEDVAFDAVNQSFGRVLCIVEERYALLERDGVLLVLALDCAERNLCLAQLSSVEPPIPQPLLIPVRIPLAADELALLTKFSHLISSLGVEIAIETHHVMVKALPLPLRQQNLQNLIPELIGYLAQNDVLTSTDLAQWFACHRTGLRERWGTAQAIGLLAEVERLCPQLMKAAPPDLLQPIDLQPALAALKHE